MRQSKRQTVAIIVAGVAMLMAFVAMAFAIVFGVLGGVTEMKACAGMAGAMCVVVFGCLQYI